MLTLSWSYCFLNGLMFLNVFISYTVNIYRHNHHKLKFFSILLNKYLLSTLPSTETVLALKVLIIHGTHPQ